MKTSEGTVSILDYAAEELAEAERLQAEEDAAAAEVTRIDKAIHGAEVAFYKRKEETRRPDRRRVLAEAALAGVEAPPEPPVPSGPTLEDLQATIDGLKALRAAAEDRKSAAHGAVRVKVIEAFTDGAQRAAADYLTTARRLGSLHEAIAAAQETLRCVGGNPPRVLVADDWHEVAVPSTDTLAALRGEGHDAHFRRYLIGGDAARSHTRSRAAFESAKNSIRARLGGRWPLDRG